MGCEFGTSNLEMGVEEGAIWVFSGVSISREEAPPHVFNSCLSLSLEYGQQNPNEEGGGRLTTKIKKQEEGDERESRGVQERSGKTWESLLLEMNPFTWTCLTLPSIATAVCLHLFSSLFFWLKSFHLFLCNFIFLLQQFI